MWRGGRSTALQGHVLIWRGPWVAAHRAEGRLADSRPDAAQRRQLPKRRSDYLVLNELLDLEQQRLALGVIELDCLLLEQRVDIRIVAVCIGAALYRECLKAGRSIAEGGAAAHNQPSILLLGKALVERRPLDWPQSGPDADFAQA